MLSPTPHYYEIMGRAAEIARALGSPVGGAEHLFLRMLHDGGWPVSAISGLADLHALDAAVVEAANAPVRPHEHAAFLPEGQRLDSPLLQAISDAVPEGTAFGFNSKDGRTWIHVLGPGGSLGRDVSREVLNTALASLGLPGLGGG